MNCWGVSAHCAGLPTAAMPAARPDAGEAGPQLRQQQIAMLAGELVHMLVGRRLVVERLHLLLLPLGRVAHLEIQWAARGPQRLEDRDLLLHRRVALFPG